VPRIAPYPWRIVQTPAFGKATLKDAKVATSAIIASPMETTTPYRSRRQTSCAILSIRLIPHVRRT